jgi:hypothetical protein
MNKGSAAMKMILLAVACLQAGTVSAAPESCKDELTAPARANLGTLKVKLASCSDRYELFVFRDKKGQPEKIDNVRVAAPKANQRWVFDGRRRRCQGREQGGAGLGEFRKTGNRRNLDAR